jgi:hypothetical protein
MKGRKIVLVAVSGQDGRTRLVEKSFAAGISSVMRKKYRNASCERSRFAKCSGVPFVRSVLSTNKRKRTRVKSVLETAAHFARDNIDKVFPQRLVVLTLAHLMRTDGFTKKFRVQFQPV